MKTAKLPLYYIGMLLMALPFFFTSCSQGRRIKLFTF